MHDDEMRVATALPLGDSATVGYNERLRLCWLAFISRAFSLYSRP